MTLQGWWINATFNGALLRSGWSRHCAGGCGCAHRLSRVVEIIHIDRISDTPDARVCAQPGKVRRFDARSIFFNVEPEQPATNVFAHREQAARARVDGFRVE